MTGVILFTGQRRSSNWETIIAGLHVAALHKSELHDMYPIKTRFMDRNFQGNAAACRLKILQRNFCDCSLSSIGGGRPLSTRSLHVGLLTKLSGARMPMSPPFRVFVKKIVTDAVLCMATRYFTRTCVLLSNPFGQLRYIQNQLSVDTLQWHMSVKTSFQHLPYFHSQF